MKKKWKGNRLYRQRQMVNKMKLRWHQFLCWLFDHPWLFIITREERVFGMVDVYWHVCGRCAERRQLQHRDKLPAHPASRRWILACAIVFLFIGLRLGSIQRSPDLPRVELAQAEIWLELRKLEKPAQLIEMVEKLLQEYREIIDWNREHYDN